MLPYGICFSLSYWLHSVWQTLGPSTSLQITQFCFFLWLSNISLYICATSSLSIHLSHVFLILVSIARLHSKNVRTKKNQHLALFYYVTLFHQLSNIILMNILLCTAFHTRSWYRCALSGLSIMNQLFAKLCNVERAPAKSLLPIISAF